MKQVLNFNYLNQNINIEITDDLALLLVCEDSSQIINLAKRIKAELEEYLRINIVYPKVNFISNLTIKENFNERSLEYDGEFANFYPAEINNIDLINLAILMRSFNADVVIVVSDEKIDVNRRPIIVIQSHDLFIDHFNKHLYIRR